MNVSSATQAQQYASQLFRQPPSTEDLFDRIMSDVDKDGDGTISEEELGLLNADQQERLSSADSDGDGTISGDELLSSIMEQIASRGEMGPPSAADMVSQIMSDADTDGDGVISAEELSAVDEAYREKLAQADADGDGIITEEELTAQVSEDIASMEGMPPPPPMEAMSLNGFKEMLASLVDTEATEGEDTATQIQDYLVSLGLDGTAVNDLMTLLENRRFDVTA